MDAGAGFTEALPGGDFQIPGRPADVASDQLHARLAAVRALVDSLDPEDRFGLIAFSEGASGGAGLDVPCAGTQGDERALLDIRHGLMGHWAIVASAPAFASDDAAPRGAPPGDLYALTGELVVDRTSGLVTATMTSRFGLGQGPGSDLAPAWDLRPTLAKP